MPHQTAHSRTPQRLQPALLPVCILLLAAPDQVQGAQHEVAARPSLPPFTPAAQHAISAAAPLPPPAPYSRWPPPPMHPARYRPVAQRGAMLFFLLNSLSKIHAFYQFSLNAFVTVYGRGLDNAPGGRRKPVRRSATTHLSAPPAETELQSGGVEHARCCRSTHATGFNTHAHTHTHTTPGRGRRSAKRGRAASDAAPRDRGPP